MNRLFLFLFPLSILACGPEGPHDIKRMPSKNYNFVDVDLRQLAVHQKLYVPVYSEIYHQSGAQRFALTATLSIRNTSMVDSMYVDEVDYYDSEGQLRRQYLSNTIRLAPLESVEFVVENREAEGGAGANFIVGWGTDSERLIPVIQTVMIGTTSQQGISFVVDGTVIEEGLEEPKTPPATDQ